MKVRLRTLLAGGAHLEVMPYTSAEIPPAGAPGVRRNAAGVCSEMTRKVWRFVRYNLFVAIVLCAAVAVQGSFWVWTGGDFFESAASHLIGEGGMRFCKCCVGKDLSPLISRLRRQLPPEGKPSVRCANMANRTLNRGLSLRSAHHLAV